MRTRTTVLLAILALLLLAGCGGGSEFLPQNGPYFGKLYSNSVEVGTFSLTAGGGFIGGTGILSHGGQNVNVSISAVVSGKSISGQIVNSGVGQGEFIGQFSNAGGAFGTYTFQSTVGQTTTTGNWTAEVD